MTYGQLRNHGRFRCDYARKPEPQEGEGVIRWATIGLIAYVVILVGCMVWRMAR